MPTADLVLVRTALAWAQPATREILRGCLHGAEHPFSLSLSLSSFFFLLNVNLTDVSPFVSVELRPLKRLECYCFRLFSTPFLTPSPPTTLCLLPALLLHIALYSHTPFFLPLQSREAETVFSVC